MGPFFVNAYTSRPYGKSIPRSKTRIGRRKNLRDVVDCARKSTPLARQSVSTAKRWLYVLGSSQWKVILQGLDFLRHGERCPMVVLGIDQCVSCWYNLGARRNGVRLCGDATWQGISGSTVRQRCIRPPVGRPTGGRSFGSRIGFSSMARLKRARELLRSENAPNHRPGEENAGDTARPTRPLPRPTSPEGR